MANTFTFPEVFSAEYQRTFFKSSVAMEVASRSAESQLSRGDTFKSSYIANGNDGTIIQKYTRGSDITIRDLTDTEESLTVDQEFADGFYVDKYDKIQDNKDAAAKYGQQASRLLMTQIDADVLGEYSNAGITVDDGSIGGTAGNGVTLSASNVDDVLAAAAEELDKNNIPLDQRFAVISPRFWHRLTLFGIGRDTDLGDAYLRNGLVGKNVYGFDMYLSTNLAGSAVLSLATQPTASDTVTIAGQTFTFVASPSAAGDIDIGANVDETRANLATLINAPGTTTAGGVALTGDALATFDNRISAVNDDSADTLTVTYKGAPNGVLTVAKSLTDGTDDWSKEKQHNLFGAKGATSLVVQDMPSVEVREPDAKLGRNFLYGTLYGVKTFQDGAQHLVNVEVDASSGL